MSLLFCVLTFVLISCGIIVYRVGIYDRGVYVESSEWKKVIRRTVELVITSVLLTLSTIFSIANGNYYAVIMPALAMVYVFFHVRLNEKLIKLFRLNRVPFENEKDDEPKNRFQMYIEYGQNAVILLMFYFVVIIVLFQLITHYAVAVSAGNVVKNEYLCDILAFFKSNYALIEKIVYVVISIITSILLPIIAMQLRKQIKYSNYPYEQRRLIGKITYSLYLRNTPM